MAITLEQIVAEARDWPPERVGELMMRLTADLQTLDLATEEAWKLEINRRVETIEAGKAQGFTAAQVLAETRRTAGL